MSPESVRGFGRKTCARDPGGPAVGSGFGLVDDPVPESVETDAKPRLSTSAMGFARDGFHAHGLGGASVGPYRCEHDDDDEGCELVGIGNVGVLDIEAAGLGVAEEALDAPPLSVVVE